MVADHPIWSLVSLRWISPGYSFFVVPQDQNKPAQREPVNFLPEYRLRVLSAAEGLGSRNAHRPRRFPRGSHSAVEGGTGWGFLGIILLPRIIQLFHAATNLQKTTWNQSFVSSRFGLPDGCRNDRFTIWAASSRTRSHRAHESPMPQATSSSHR
jgi:hypothetical protein